MMTDEEFRIFMANLATDFTAKLHESRVQFEARQAQVEIQLAELRAQSEVRLAESHARLEAQLAKTDAQLAKTDKQLKELSELFGNVNKNRGEEAEEFFFRSLEKNPQIGQVKFDTIYRNFGGSKHKIQDEFDLILTNGDSLALIEVKTKAHLDLVDQMIEKKIPHLRLLFPKIENYKIYAGIASLVSYEALIEKTRGKSLFLLTQQGKHIELVNQAVPFF